MNIVSELSYVAGCLTVCKFIIVGSRRKQMKCRHNNVRANAPTHLISAVVLALSLVTLTALVCPTSLAWQDAKARHEVTGRWQGKFPSEQVAGISDADNPVAVEVTIKDEGGTLSGTAVFYVIRNTDDKPQVKGKTESALIEPQFDGTLLKFSVKAKGPQSGKEENIEMQMRLTSATEAELENMSDSSSPIFEMKKVQ